MELCVDELDASDVISSCDMTPEKVCMQLDRCVRLVSNNTCILLPTEESENCRKSLIDIPEV
jgi:hypothetical protein